MSHGQLDRTPLPTVPDARPWLRRAWASLALVPVFFLIAFAVGEGIYAAMGYKPENADAPVWADVVASVLILAVAVVPSVTAVYCGRRATVTGDRRGLYPAVIGALVGIGLAILTVVTAVGNAVGG